MQSPAYAGNTPSHARRNRVASPCRQAYRSEEHTSELQSRLHLVCRLLLEKKTEQAGRVVNTPGINATLRHEASPGRCRFVLADITVRPLRLIAPGPARFISLLLLNGTLQV